MPHPQNQSKEGTKNSMSPIESIPEDVSSIIATFIKNWAEMEGGGSLEKKELGRISRDATLRAIALTSSRNFPLWHPELLQSVVLSKLSIISFFSCLRSGEPYRAQTVKSLHLHWGKAIDMKQWSRDSRDSPELYSYSSLSEPITSLPLLKAHLTSSLRHCTQALLHRLPNLRDLTIQDPRYLFDFQSKINDKLIPLPFLSLSLTRLYIEQFLQGPSISARNAVWLLVFCQNLEHVCLGFNISRIDIKFLEEYKLIYKGKSNVKKLSIMTMFLSDKEAQSFGDPSFSLIGHNSGFSAAERRKSISNLLGVTKQLECFEINSIPSVSLPPDANAPRGQCLEGLSASFDSLKHLRLIDLQGFDFPLPLESFKKLETLALSEAGFSGCARQKVALDIEVLHLTHYGPRNTAEEYHFEEEDFLMLLYKNGWFPKLKEIVVPKHPIDLDNRIIESGKKKWAEKRRILKSNELIKSGEIKLREMESGENAAGEGLQFMSYYRWLSH